MNVPITSPAEIDLPPAMLGRLDAVAPRVMRPRKRSWLRLAGLAALTYGSAWLGARVSRPRGLWYRLLRKPSYQPPSWVFGPVWTALYASMAYSADRVLATPPSTTRTLAIGAWGVQLVLNAAWTPIFFGAHRSRWALVDLVALGAAATAYTACAAKVDRTAAVVMTPYLGWLGFAAALNGAIVTKNPRWLAG